MRKKDLEHFEKRLIEERVKLLKELHTFFSGYNIICYIF